MVCSGFVLPLLKPGFILLEVGSCKFVIEENFDIRHFIELIQKALVEARSIYCANELPTD